MHRQLHASVCISKSPHFGDPFARKRRFYLHLPRVTASAHSSGYIMHKESRCESISAAIMSIVNDYLFYAVLGLLYRMIDRRTRWLRISLVNP